MMNAPRPEQQFFRADAQARLEQACSAPIGFVERLTAFWSNHFCVSVAKSGVCRAAAGAFEREAIRPHVLGRFADMLRAVEQHPAMLNFLDNAQSIGPNSAAGHNNKPGLNENLAREILELHTMGVDSGYSQNDVTQLANILTGWTIVGRDGRLGEPGASPSIPTRMSRWRRRCAAVSMSKTASPKARRRSPTSRVSRRRRHIWRPSSLATSSPTRPIRRWSGGSPKRFATATAISPPSPARSSPTKRRGARR